MKWRLLAFFGALALVTALWPFWPEILFYLAVLWFGCPSYNALSSSCGAADFGFIVSRLTVGVAILIGIPYFIWGQYGKRK